MTDLTNYSNIYADLAQSAYTGRKDPNGIWNNFAQPKNWTDNQIEALSNGDSVPFTFSGAKDSSGNDVSSVHLQPAIKISTHTYTSLPNPNDSYYNPNMQEVQRNVMSNFSTGFNSYLVTDQKELKDTTQAYLAVRGSDAAGVKIENWHADITDWLKNDAVFALTNTQIPQADDAYQALKASLRALPKDAKLDVTAHSLGTIGSVQGVALIVKNDPADFDRIGKLVLFDGPDTRTSLENMGLSAAQIEAISAKTTYYVSPFDLVSMLNRTQNPADQLGTVHYIIPKNFNSTLEIDDSAHDFGEFQMMANGQLRVANPVFNGPLIEAGQKVSNLIAEDINRIQNVLGVGPAGATAIMDLILSGRLSEVGGTTEVVIVQGVNYTVAQILKIKDDFFGKNSEYQRIIDQAKRETKSENKTRIKEIRAQLQGARGSVRVMLIPELLQRVAQNAQLNAQDYLAKIESKLDSASGEVGGKSSSGISAVDSIGTMLSSSEMQGYHEQLKKSVFWDSGTEQAIRQAAENYAQEIDGFSSALYNTSDDIQNTDREGADMFKNELDKVSVPKTK
ncbi:hypothetical protein [Lactovum odontotermitis]